MTDKAKTGLDLLREPFPARLISKLPKPTKKQTDEIKAAMDRKDFTLGIRCTLCGAWHHKDVVHLDYVGHAALTDRLLDADPNWAWEPLAFHEGLPAFDNSGGLWIKLTVCGVTRLGYGHAAGKPQQDPGAREKEVIGDALRNAAMRFGAALDLWHKGDLHGDAEAELNGQNGGSGTEGSPSTPAAPNKGDAARDEYSRAETAIRAAGNKVELKAAWEGVDWSLITADWTRTLTAEKDERLRELNKPKPMVAPNFDAIRPDPFDDLPEDTKQAVKLAGTP